MKTNYRQRLVLSAAVCLAAHVSAASEEFTNRFTASARVGFRISGQFKGIGNGLFTGGPVTPRLTPDGDAYNYDDGYLLTDVSGNLGGQTWYVGYDDSATQISGNQLLLSRSTANASLSGADQDADNSVGFEVAYQHQLGYNKDYAWGIDASVNYQPVHFSDNGNYAAAVTKVTDAYAFTPGTTPPSATPGAPYQGSFGGPGFLFGDSIVGTSTQAIPSGAMISGSHEFVGRLSGGHLGAYGERQFGQRLRAGLAGGLALGILTADAGWSETATLPGGGTVSLSGIGSDVDVLVGFYLGATAAYKLTEDLHVLGGVQYQFLNDYSHDFAGRTVELDFSGAIYVTLGLSWSF